MARHKYVSQTVDLVFRTPQERVKIARRRAIVLVAWISLVWSLMLGILVVQGIAVFGIRHSLQPNLGNILGFIGVVAALPLYVQFYMALAIPSRDGIIGADALHGALVRADSTFAPRAEHQPEPLSEEAVAGTYNALPEYPLRATRIDRILLAFALLMVLAGVIILALIALEVISIVPTSSDHSIVVLAGFLLPFSLAGICSQYALQGRDILHPPLMTSLAIDDQGIHWQEVGRQTRMRTLAWQDIRAFCVQKQFFIQSYQTAYTYLLLGANTNFGWIVWQSPTAPEYRASGLLGQLVVTKTGLPLLDISESADALNWLIHRQHERAMGQSAQRVQADLAQAIVAEGEGQPMLISAEFEQHINLPLSRFYLRNALVMALLTIGFCVVWLLHG